MALYRCNKCAYLAEVGSEAIGTTTGCPKCAQPNTTYDTVFYVRKLLEKYFAQQAFIKREMAEENIHEPAESPQPAPLDGINIYNTDLISTDLQHGPIHDWFQARKIRIKTNLKAVDTTGFFDEVAVELGKNYESLRMVVEQIRHGQIKSFGMVKIGLDQLSQKETQAVTAFCRQLYEYSFVAKYIYQKSERLIRLGLQGSPLIKKFFAGEWLEWFALMRIMELCQERHIPFSCARNLSIQFANEDLHELDVFYLLNGKSPVCIECKTGEFRSAIDKYVVLKKRLGLEPRQFVICIVDLTDEQASGLSSMYGLKFVNERGLVDHVAGLL